MAISITKDIGLENEASFGASRAGTLTKMHISEVEITTTTNKELVADTPNNAKGYDRITRTFTEIGGSIKAFASIRNLHHALEWVNGVAGTTTASGTSGLVVTYNQNTNGSYISKTVNIDREASQEKFSGVVAKELEISGKNGLVELDLAVIGKSRSTGTSMGYTTGETITPFNFADVTVKLANGASFAASGISVLPVSEWSVKYNNGLDGTFLSGNREIARVDSKIPRLTGSFTIFHEYSSFTDQMIGSTDYSLRIEATLPPEQGVITGTSQYYLRIDIPRIQTTSSVRKYKADNLAMEDVEFTAMFEPGVSALWTPSITMGMGNV